MNCALWRRPAATSEDISRSRTRPAAALSDLYANLNAVAEDPVRAPQRPHLTDFSNALITEFTPLSGDPQVR